MGAQRNLQKMSPKPKITVPLAKSLTFGKMKSIGRNPIPLQSSGYRKHISAAVGSADPAATWSITDTPPVRKGVMKTKKTS